MRRELRELRELKERVEQFEPYELNEPGEQVRVLVQAHFALLSSEFSFLQSQCGRCELHRAGRAGVSRRIHSDGISRREGARDRYSHRRQREYWRDERHAGPGTYRRITGAGG